MVVERFLTDAADLRLTGPDEFFGLIMPTAAHSLDGLENALADGDRANLRAVIASCDSAWRPELRWYTFRALDRENATACFDVATHGKRTGRESTDDHTFPAPGLNWVLRAQPGDECAIYASRGLWHHPSSRQLLIADPSALPSVWAILEYCQRFHPDTLRTTRVIALAETVAEYAGQCGRRHGPLCAAPGTTGCPRTRAGPPTPGISAGVSVGQWGIWDGENRTQTGYDGLRLGFRGDSVVRVLDRGETAALSLENIVGLGGHSAGPRPPLHGWRQR